MSKPGDSTTGSARTDQTKPANGGDEVTYADVATISGGPLSAIRPEDRAAAMRGAQILARCLQLEGVDVLFGYPGGQNLEIFDVLRDFDIRCIRVEHEQGAAHAAEGFARASGRVGVCLATSGPGATNLVTGIGDAFSDSVPIVALTGNVPTAFLGKNAFQEVDIVSITQPITKKSFLADSIANLPAMVRRAFALAKSNRPGPVLIDVPKDIQQHYPRDAEGRYAPPRMPAVVEPMEEPVGPIHEDQLDEACRMVRQARKPIIYAGGGVVSSDSADLLLRLAERLNCPVTTTFMGIGAFPADHPLALHVLGMHGTKYANIAVNEADLVLAVGVRFDDRVTGKLSEFIKHGKIIHIDIDRRELNKNKPVTLPICADIRPALSQLIECVSPGRCDEWTAYVSDLKRRFPMVVPADDGRTIRPQSAIATLARLAPEAIFTTGVGQHQMWAMQHLRSVRPRSFISSGGFGTMGFGLPAAIGAKVACPDRLVVDVDGDGSLNMTVHELSTCHRYDLGVKVMVINNQTLGMPRQWQDIIYKGHRAESSLRDPHAVRRGLTDDIYPDFLPIAAGYRLRAERVRTPAELEPAVRRMLADPNEPYLLDVIVHADENVYPMIPAGASYHDIICSDEDLRRR